MGGFFALIVLFSSFDITAMVSPIQKLNSVKADLNTEFGFPVDRELCVLTVTRTPIQSGPSSLISHHELEQLLRLLSASCVNPGSGIVRWFRSDNAADIAAYNNGGVHLNDYLDDGALLNGLPSSDMCSINRTRQKLGAYFVDNNLANKCKLVVFNEMFFSQELPLDVGQRDFINQQLFTISRRTHSTIFYPNFLYSEQRLESGTNIHIKFNNMEALKNSGHMVINDVYFNSCKRLVGQIPNCGILFNKYFLINESFSICNGRILTKYRKVSYFHENDMNIGSGDLYDSGPGYDEAFGPPSSLQSTFLRNFTTDICFDLNTGIRRMSVNNWTNPFVNHPKDSCLHIVQSNSIDPFYNANCSMNLPIDRGVIHVDKYPHPSWNTPNVSRPQDVYLPYRNGNAITDDIIGDKEEFHVRFVKNDYRFTFLQI